MNQSTSLVRPEPGEFRAGWPILLLALLGITTSAGVMPVYSLGSLVIPLENQFGWSRSSLQPAISSFFVGMIVAAILAGPFLKYVGLRHAALISLGLTTFVFLMMSAVTEVWMLYALYFIVLVAGLGVLQITWTHLVSLWFSRNRGLALAIILSGTGLSALILPTLLDLAIQAGGWRGGFWMLAGLTGVLTLPVCLLCFPSARRTAAASDKISDGAVGVGLSGALRSYNFWAQCTAMSLVVVGILAMVTNLVPLLQDRGLTATTANSIFGVVGISLILGRLLAGYLIDRMWAPGVAFVMLILPAAGCLLLLSDHQAVWMLVVAAALIGIGAGAEYDIAAYLVARYFGLVDYSRIFSVHFGVISVGVCLSPVFFGYLYDISESYRLVLQICIACFVLGSTLVLTLGRYPQFGKTH